MREVKFRGINHEDDKFVYGFYTRMISGARKYDAIIMEADGDFISFYIHNAKTIGQYIGMKDSNGREIYEGDCFKINDIVYFIEYNKEKCCYILTTGQNLNPFDTIGLEWINALALEIVGNIHENKELLI